MGENKMKCALTIAGSDCSGGAGIQADIKTIAAHKIYGESVITALTAQNTTGVYGVIDVPAAFVAKQLDCVFKDIPPDAVKTGMLSKPEIIKAVAAKLKYYKAKNIVVDPVMVSTSGAKLINAAAVKALKRYLFPLASLITPNIPEAEVLSGIKIKNAQDILRAARLIGGTVLIKGGHSGTNADDLLLYKGKAVWFKAKRINNPNTHGTGCTLSSAIACNLAAGLGMAASVKNAKRYVTAALKAGLDLGAGSGPLNHACAFKK